MLLDATSCGFEPLASLDPTRRVGVVEADGPSSATDRQFPGLTMPRIREVAVSLAAAEEAGGARWCLETASEYAKVRQQFGRPIGQFQAVKHKLANMLVTVEEITAVAWDAGQAVTARTLGRSRRWLPRWPGPSCSTGTRRTPRTASSSWAGSGLPGNTMPISI